MKSLGRGALVLTLGACATASHAVLGNLLDASGVWDKVGMVRTSGGSGSGVPISSRWVLTAGHVVRSSTSGTITNPATTTFRLGSLASGTNYGVAQIIPHPLDDIALIRTTTDLPGAYGMNLNVVSNQSQFDIVGFGYSATWNGSSWVSQGGPSYGTRRRGQNQVSNSFDVNDNTGFNRWRMMYRYDFDGNGIDTFGDGGPLTGGEALGFSGDSGGGLFVNQQVIGLHVGRFTSSIQYGTVGAAVQLAYYRDFITGTTGLVPEPASLAAVGFGLAALSLRRRKRAA